MDMIGKTLGNLRITEKIGEGGMGIVYKAEHVKLENYFAIKSLSAGLTEDPGFRERFHREARNQALLDHPNIVQAIDFFDEDNQFFFVMKFADGQPLDQIISQRAPLPDTEALSIFKGILSGLDFAHSNGIIHRDIKPSNVIVDKTGRPRITDFGIAILVGDKRLTSTGKNIGSPWYMSPEQILLPDRVDHRTDVYSSAIVLYEMLTGKIPFDADTEYLVKHQQVNDKVPDPKKLNPSISPQIVNLIDKGLEKKPDNRFSGCGEYLKAVNEIQKIDGTQKRKFPIFSVMLVLLVIGLVTAFLVIKISDTYNQHIDNGQAIEHQRESAYVLVEGAVNTLSDYCREYKVLQKKRERKIIGKEALGSTATFEKLDARIREHESNITDHQSRFHRLSTQLSTIEMSVVKSQLEKYHQFLVQNESFYKVPFLQLVERYYQVIHEDMFDTFVEEINGQCLSN